MSENGVYGIGGNWQYKPVWFFLHSPWMMNELCARRIRAPRDPQTSESQSFCVIRETQSFNQSNCTLTYINHCFLYEWATCSGWLRPRAFCDEPLVSHQVCSRGLDIKDVTHVVNLDMATRPQNEQRLMKLIQQKTGRVYSCLVLNKIYKLAIYQLTSSIIDLHHKSNHSRSYFVSPS